MKSPVQPSDDSTTAVENPPSHSSVSAPEVVDVQLPQESSEAQPQDKCAPTETGISVDRITSEITKDVLVIVDSTQVPKAYDESDLRGSPDLEIDTLAEGTLKVLPILESWRLARNSFNDTVVISLVTSVDEHGDAYCAAAWDCLGTVDEHLKMVDDAIELCGIIHAAGKSRKKLGKWLQSMLVMVNNAHQSASDAKHLCWTIRIKFMEIRKDFPDVKPRIEEDSIERESETSRCLLETAHMDLHAFVDSSGHFVDFWSSVTMDLRYLESVIPHITIETFNSLRLDTVLRRWMLIKRKLTRYSEKIRSIEDTRPDLRTRAAAWAAGRDNNDGK